MKSLFQSSTSFIHETDATLSSQEFTEMFLSINKLNYIFFRNGFWNEHLKHYLSLVRAPRPLLRMLGMDLLFTFELEERTWSFMGWPEPSYDGQDRIENI